MVLKLSSMLFNMFVEECSTTLAAKLPRHLIVGILIKLLLLFLINNLIEDVVVIFIHFFRSQT